MLNWRLVRVGLYLTILLAALLVRTPVSGQAQGQVYVVALSGGIDPNSVRYVRRALRSAQEAEGQLILLEIDTAGGLVSSTRDMVREILKSPLPVVTYVTPAGAQATSAGAFISAAGHLAAMTPGTNIGASTPVDGAGRDLPETLADKATNDAAALIRSIAQARGRNAEKLEAMVREAASFTYSEALELDIIDLVASDRVDLLVKLDGLEVSLRGRPVWLETRGVQCTEPYRRCAVVDRTPTERFLDVISEPNLAAILLTLGGLGLFVEFLNPGLLFPGVFGLIMLALAFVALGNLPVNWAGVGLILFALVLMYFELQVGGVGILGLGALVSFLLGAFLLFAPFTSEPPSISGPDVSISPLVMAALGGGMASGVGLIILLAWRGKTTPPAGPRRSRVVGMTGRVTRTLDPIGEVYVGDEDWSAEELNRVTVEEGQRVEVVDLEGLTVKVRVQGVNKVGVPEGPAGAANTSKEQGGS